MGLKIWLIAVLLFIVYIAPSLQEMEDEIEDAEDAKVYDPYYCKTCYKWCKIYSKFCYGYLYFPKHPCCKCYGCRHKKKIYYKDETIPNEEWN